MNTKHLFFKRLDFWTERHPVKAIVLLLLVVVMLSLTLIGLVAGGQWLVECLISGWCG